MIGQLREWPRLGPAAQCCLALGMSALLVSACDSKPEAPPTRVGEYGPFPGMGDLHTIHDPLGPTGPGPALDVSLPVGWKVESSVRWDNVNGQCSYGIASPMFRMTSPDGRASIEQFPGFYVTTDEQAIRRRGSSPGDFCIVARADTGRALAEIALRRLRPQARIVDIRDIRLDPAIEVRWPQMQLLQSIGGGSLYTVEAFIENPDGTSEKFTLGGMILAGQPLVAGAPPLVQNQNMVAYSVRAPAAQFADTEHLARTVRATIRSRPEWQSAVNQRWEEATARTSPVMPGPSYNPSPDTSTNVPSSSAGGVQRDPAQE